MTMEKLKSDMMTLSYRVFILLALIGGIEGESCLSCSNAWLVMMFQMVVDVVKGESIITFLL